MKIIKIIEFHVRITIMKISEFQMSFENQEHLRTLNESIKKMKISKFHWRIMKMMKLLEFHAITMKIMKIIEFH